MDIKAMAKSKRSHTQHNQPKKPHHHSKTPSSSSSSSATVTQNSSGSKTSKKEGRERKRGTQPATLPSNWARYEDEGSEEEEEEGTKQQAGDQGEPKEEQIPIDSDSDEPSGLAASKGGKTVPDVVKPKSKGADYSYLITQAKESHSYHFPSFDDTLPDFYQGLGRMLAVRGKNILSWGQDDDFVVEDEATTSEEVPFLTLDLEALAEQLAKVDLAKRLFIEADLLPPELRAEGSNKDDNQQLFQTPKEQKKKALPQTFGELYSLYLADEQITESQNYVEKNGELISSSVTSSFNPEQLFSSDVKESKLDDLGFPNAIQISSDIHISEKDSTPSSRFDSAVAEAELDMLLGSFSETQTKVDTSMNEHDIQVSFSQGNSATHESLLDNLLEPSRTVFPITSSLDYALDDLLEETSKPDNKDGLLQTVEVKGVSLDLPSSSSSSSHPISKSSVMEDFDSWLDSL